MDAIYLSANSFKIMGDETSNFVAGRRVKMNCGLDGIKYAAVESSLYSLPYTTVIIDESGLTAALTSVFYGIISPGAIGSLPDHTHDGSEGSGGTISGTGGGGTVSGTDDHTHAAYVTWDFGSNTISGTGDIYAGVFYGDGSQLTGISGSGGGTSDVQSFLDLNDTPLSYDSGKYLISTASGIEWATISGTGTGTGEALHLAKMTRDAAQSIPSDGNEKIDFDNIEFDTGGIASTDTGRFTIKTAGRYLVNAACMLVDSLDSGEGLWIFIYKNGATARFYMNYTGVANGYGSVEINEIMDLEVDDYLELYVFHNEGSAQNTRSSVYDKPRMSVIQLAESTGGSSATPPVATSYYGYELIDEWELNDEALDVTVSGLSGNTTDSVLMVDFEILATEAVPPALVGIFNNDTTDTNYTRSFFGTYGSATVVATDSPWWAGAGVEIAYCAGAADSFARGRSDLYLKSGSWRTCLTNAALRTTTGSAYTNDRTSSFWENTADEVTTFRIKTNAGAKATGRVRLYRQANLVLPSGSGSSISKGKQSLQVEYATASGIYINPGEIHIGSSMYELDSRTLVDVSGLAADTWYFVYTSDASTFTVSSGVPTIDYSNMGYYNGNDRCIGFVHTDVSGNILEFSNHNGVHYFAENIDVTTDWHVVSSEETYALNLPIGNMLCKMYLFGRPETGVTDVHFIFRSADKSSGRASFHSPSSSAYVSGLFEVVCDESKEIIASASSYDVKFRLWQQGFHLPDYIYTGA